MKFAEITITICVDETELTPAQKQLADQSDTNLSIDHPLMQGYDSIVAMIENVAAGHFNYLMGNAVTIEVE